MRRSVPLADSNMEEIQEICRDPDYDDDEIDPEDALTRLYRSATELVESVITSFIDVDVESIVLGWFRYRVRDTTSPINRLKEIIMTVMSAELSFDIESLCISIFRNAPMFMQIRLTSLSETTASGLKEILANDVYFYDAIEKGAPGNTRYRGFKFLSVIRNSNVRNKMLLSLMRFITRDDVNQLLHGAANQIILICILDDIARCHDDMLLNSHQPYNWVNANGKHVQKLGVMYDEMDRITSEEIENYVHQSKRMRIEINDPP